MHEECEKAIHECEKRGFDLTQEVTVIKLEQTEFRFLLKENTDATKRIEANTAEMLDVFESFKGAMKVTS